ncbi:hypothetical protein KEM52_000653 [Ascosphaera acerosa]|nr:hypothetical protein KEM52_000653 [Ascosphaera acerosa]
MRNLRTTTITELPLPGDLPLTATAWDAATDALVCAFGPTEEKAVIELKRRDPTCTTADGLALIASWDAPSPLPDLPADCILSLQYFSDTSTACLVLAGGDIIVVREDAQPGEEQIEIVGSVDAGITGAAWTPDEELLAVTTRADTLLFMTRSFDGVADVTLTEADLNASRHVSVGWGKKETQFQGKGAKALKDPTMPEKVDEGVRSKYDDGRTHLSWRGDGAFLAVSSLQATSRRVIRVYSREGVLDSVSEPVDHMDAAVSWRPAGNLIAAVQRQEAGCDVIFFERNGLRHGQFSLRLSKEDMETWASSISLQWNIDSTVLAVMYQDRVQLWTMGNYHYYLKQEIPISSSRCDHLRVTTVRWHQERALRCAIASTTSLMDLGWVFDVSRGSTCPPFDFGAVAVIDGTILKLTALRMATVSPPMAGHELQLKHAAVDVAFSQSGRRFAVLTGQGVSVYDWRLNRRPTPEPALIRHFPTPVSQARRTRLAMLGENEIVVLGTLAGSKTELTRICIDTGDETTGMYKRDQHRIVSVYPDSSHHHMWYQEVDAHGRVGYMHTPGTAPAMLSQATYHASSSQGTSYAAVTVTTDGQSILISLTRSGHLFADDRLLAKNCTSFLVTSQHLIYTTTTHHLKFVHLAPVDQLDLPGDAPETDERVRSIERGARLVSVVPSTFVVTLQMPRGNLENVYPRALTLAGVRKYIDAKDYRAAYLTCRSQIVDLNILHDYAPEQFMDNIPLFLDQVHKIEYIDEFLSRLSNDNVAQTLYRDTLKVAGEPVPATVTATASTSATNGKVNKICDGFISVLSTRVDTNLQNLVTAHVCKSPPDLEAALALVTRLKKQSAEQAEEAVEHMCFLTDAHRLYDHALGTYDLDLTLMVAQQAQRDPREYLPFLQKLQETPDLRRKFAIDNHLGRHVKALRSLHALESFDEVRAYTVKHLLYNEALALYKYQPEPFRNLSKLYADYLHASSNHKEAALAYESLQLYESAYKAYNLAHMWRECLYCASLVPLGEEQMRELAGSLATVLVDEERDYVSAAQIHAQYLDDVTQAARLYCRGSQFGEACRLLTLHREDEDEDEEGDPGAAQAGAIDLLGLGQSGGDSDGV